MTVHTTNYTLHIFANQLQERDDFFRQSCTNPLYKGKETKKVRAKKGNKGTTIRHVRGKRCMCESASGEKLRILNGTCHLDATFASIDSLEFHFAVSAMS